MNPAVEASRAELARWLQAFANTHAKRECAQIEAVVAPAGPGPRSALALRLTRGHLVRPASDAPPLEFGLEEVAEGRTRFAWCEELAQQLRAEARMLAGRGPGHRRTP